MLTTHYLEEAQQRADRVGLMHRGELRREGSVAELTRQLPGVIRFGLPPTAPRPPVEASSQPDGTHVVETFALARDLKHLLQWADDHRVELQGLSAGPTRLDDVFRPSTPTTRRSRLRPLPPLRAPDPSPPHRPKDLSCSPSLVTS